MADTQWTKDYYDNGNTYCETPYVNQQREGVVSYWRECGALQWTLTYRNGVRHGLDRRWYASGTLERERIFVNGLIHGARKIWHKSGELHDISYWVNGQLRRNLSPLEILVLFGEEESSE